MTEIVSEYIIQPRTGSQCPTNSTVCQPEDYKTYSWVAADDGRMEALTLGFADNQNVNGTTCAAKTANGNYWIWGGSTGDNHAHAGTNMCIVPVKELCGIDHWDGASYDYPNWPITKLQETVDSANFPATCNQDNGKGNVGGETSTFVQSCPVQCNYDASKFTTLAHVQEYEKKYGKYPKKSDSCTKKLGQQDPAGYRECLRTGGSELMEANPTTLYTDNYNKIMENFCSQESTHCNIDPQTIITQKQPTKMPKCSYLMSSGQEGTYCKKWLNSLGPFKSNQMEQIGNKYCTSHPQNLDCSCFSKDNPKSPNYADYMTVATELAPLGAPPACWYRPCADPTNYIIGTKDFTPLSSTNTDATPEDGYGFKCIDQLCASVIRQSDAAYTVMDGNSLYIQCGEGIKPVSILKIEMFMKTNPILFSLFVVVAVLLLLLVFMLIYRHHLRNKKTVVAIPK